MRDAPSLKMTMPSRFRTRSFIPRDTRRFISSRTNHSHASSAHVHAEEQAEAERTSDPSSSSISTTRPAINTGSAKLFADALLEESSPSTSHTSERVARLVRSHTQEQNWDGEERIQDAVLRMLMDKYKPLRGPAVKSADEKLKERPPDVHPSSPAAFPPVYEDKGDSSMLQIASTFSADYQPNWQTRASEPLLPAVEGHRPWHTTFTPPSSARIKTGSFTPSSARRSTLSLDSDEPIKQDISAARRSATAQRLGRARESTLDYRLGLSRRGSREGQGQVQARRPMPAGMKAWASLVEERIERARLQGQFKTLKGRGKSMEREVEERNPFIAREEFLMNRIVQRNQAAPPWVELQAEVETAIQNFRILLQQNWTRRLILHLTSSLPSSKLLSLTLEDVRAIRDTKWINREAAYHASALGEVNDVVRRYNGVAPYSVRKPYFVKETELERVYWACAGDVLEGMRERMRKGEVVGRKTNTNASANVNEMNGGWDEDEWGGVGSGGGGSSREGNGRIGSERKGLGIWEALRAWVASTLRT